MSKNFEQNFSLKDWVTKRAANMPEALEEDLVLQVQNGADIVMRNEKPLERSEEPVADMEETKQQHKMTARISNGMVAPALPASPAQQIQIVRLLRDLGDRLRQSEKEREILWRELDSCRKLLTDIEDKTMDAAIPPITAMARGCNICDPAPNASDSGIMPATVASAVIRMGRRRRSPASIMASSTGIPSARKR